MKTQIKLAVFALLLTLNSQLSTVFAQGSLTPPGAPAPTMKSLDQIEARTPISSAPYTISAPGSYYLTTNVTTAVSNAITIAVSGVTLDLNGFNIYSSVPNAANGGAAILLNSGLQNISIKDGFIQGGATNNGSGVYTGSGFGYGILYSGSAPVNVRVSGVSVAECLYYGIFLATRDSTLAENCTVRTVGAYGIIASIIKGSSVVDCGSYAIAGDQLSDCRGQSSGSGDGVNANSSAQNCYGQSSSGDGVFAITAQNCYGDSGDGGYGVYAYTAQNCYGESDGSGYGLFADEVATGCYGYSSTGTGLYAFIANVCSGSSISTSHNVNSY